MCKRTLRRITRDEWTGFQSESPSASFHVNEADDAFDPVPAAEVKSAYLPLVRLLKHKFDARKAARPMRGECSAATCLSAPFILAITGSVAAGKSTFAKLLQTLLRQLPNKPHVDLLTTDGFLFPNAVLDERGLLRRKGFPETYDDMLLSSVLSSLREGQPSISVPVYSHRIYDIVPHARQVIKSPDILLVEGLNVLTSQAEDEIRRSSFFDFSIYIDAEDDALEHWYVQRFLTFQKAAAADSSSYFFRFRKMSNHEMTARAIQVWREINLPNLLEHIIPARNQADLIFRKGRDHSLQEILLQASDHTSQAAI